ncbi:UNVERIFIED_CONTAM: LysM domain receptor-like kinase [Sesamum calycinum]|uniref:LysM domain receptor-like kinase n=1 Tax=Sesamum calycinum TaxID=2727403 RepID=A0AAW2PPV0_9LAMI
MTTSAEKHMHPFTCSDKIQSCSALLYQHNGFQRNEIASLYSVNASEIKPASYSNKQDYLVPVNCSCKNVNGTVGYFYDVVYKPKPNDTFYDVTNQNFSGQVWGEGVDTNLTAGVETTLHLLCGCVDDDSQVVVTYTVQPHDTVSTIATVLSAEVDWKLNPYLAPNPSYIDVGWLLYVPMEKYGLPAPNKEITGFESEKPTLYSIEEIAQATNDFDETRKIGQGGYGSVYYGIIGEKEVAIKKMRSNKSKEFLAELRSYVELLGYASGDDHLYLVYEYVQNGSLSDHLHDPLLKDVVNQVTMSWNARTQVALDAARVADFGLAKLVGRTNEEELIATRLVGTPGYLPPESVKELQVTSKTDVFAFGVVLAELITGQRALTRDNQEPSKMRSLITVNSANTWKRYYYQVNNIFKEQDPEAALELIIDRNLKGNYPPEDVYKMAEIAEWCLSEEAIDRPEMREVVVALSRIRISTIEWEASLGGSSQVFSGVFNGR